MNIISILNYSHLIKKALFLFIIPFKPNFFQISSRKSRNGKSISNTVRRLNREPFVVYMKILNVVNKLDHHFFPFKTIHGSNIRPTNITWKNLYRKFGPNLKRSSDKNLIKKLTVLNLKIENLNRKKIKSTSPNFNS